MNTKLQGKIRSISLDPGITTGYSIGLVTTNHFKVSCDQSKLNETNLYEFLEEWKPRFIIYETFEKRQNKQAVELFSRNLIGIMNLYSSKNKCTITPQTPSYGKGHYTDAKLKKLDLYIPGREHGRDALRHHLQWWTFGEGYQFNFQRDILLSTSSSLMVEGEDY